MVWRLSAIDEKGIEHKEHSLSLNFGTWVFA